MNSRLFATFVLCAFALTAPSRAQQPVKPLFAASDPIHVVIQAPLSAITRNREGKDTVAGTHARRLFNQALGTSTSREGR